MTKTSLEKKIRIFTDGSCLGNPGPGGWAASLVYKSTKKLISGSQIQTTNNQMELRAAIEALNALKKTCDVDLFTDSIYVKNGISSWIKGWKKNGWKNAKKQAVKNKELWQELDRLNQIHRITWHWVKAHDGHPENEEVDELAQQKARELLETQS